MQHAVVVAIALAAGLAGCRSAEPPPAPPRLVVWEHPTPELAATGEAYPGAVRAQVETDLAFRVAGKIAVRHAGAGDTVAAGAPLAALDPQDAQLNVAAGRTGVAAAEADLQLAESELQRHRDLLARGFVSQSLVDLRENQAQLARARRAEAQARLDLVRNQSSYTTLKADGDGVITAVLAEAGQVVAAGQPVMRFAERGRREVVISVPEGKYAEVRDAGTLQVTLWALPGKVYPARVREISPQADAATRTHEARIAIPSAGPEVQLGMTATVHAGGPAGAPSFRLPLTALAGAPGNPAVWVIDGNRVRSVPVRLARYLEHAAIVEGALQAEDRVVTAGVQLLVDGMEVRPLRRSPNGGGT